MFIRRKSIAFKYLTAFILILVLPTILIGFFIKDVYMDNLIENSSQSLMQTLRQITIGVNNEVTRISMIASTISNDDSIIGLLNMWNRTEDISEKFDISQQINSKLNYILNNSGQVETIIFLFNGSGMYTYKNEPIISEDVIKGMDWYKQSQNDKGKVRIHGTLKSFTYNSLYQYVISASFSPAFAGENEVISIYFAFRIDNLDSFYSGIKIANKGQMLIVDNKNQILASSNTESIGRDIREIGFNDNVVPDGSNIMLLNGEKALVSAENMLKIGWKVINITPYKELTEEVEQATRLVFFIVMALLALFIVFSLTFFREIILPINNLIKKMKNVEKGNFDETIEIKRNDELYQLGESFNTMVRQIKRLIIERDLKERQRNQAEIEVLQSQINPHFLSNTLNSIRLMAMIAKVDSIKDMTDALIKLVHASFAKQGKFIPIAEEIENLNSYLHIMKVRYGDKFDTYFEIEEGLEQYYVLRLILQPIVENSILHGVSELEKKGLIRIKGYKIEHDVFFEIEDNGVGMTQEQVERLLEDDKSNTRGFSKIGIKNVDKRIKLNHGKNYGLKIDSIYGQYTRITIKLPATVKKEGELSYV